MAKFIEVTSDGTKWLINTNIIEQVSGSDCGSTIYLAFNCPDAYEQDHMTVEESYSQIREMLMGGEEDG